MISLLVYQHECFPQRSLSLGCIWHGTRFDIKIAQTCRNLCLEIDMPDNRRSETLSTTLRFWLLPSVVLNVCAWCYTTLLSILLSNVQFYQKYLSHKYFNRSIKYGWIDSCFGVIQNAVSLFNESLLTIDGGLRPIGLSSSGAYIETFSSALPNRYNNIKQLITPFALPGPFGEKQSKHET